MALYVTTFDVNGESTFPVDMLRYDECFPSRGEDGTEMIHRIGRDVERVATAKPIKLRHIGSSALWQPTFERWRSFGWEAGNVTRHKL